MGEATASAPVKLYVILGSHACRAAILMLEHKRVAYETHTFTTGLHPVAVRLKGFPGQTVPALEAEGERVQTNAAIARYLDRIEPEPPLFPADAEMRGEVEEAERWGADELQMLARRLTMAGGLDGPDGLLERGASGRLGPLLMRRDLTRYLGARVVGRLRFGVTKASAAAMLEELPAALDRVDAWIEAGVLNGPELNAADFVIAPNLALLTYRADFAADLADRPCQALIDRLLPAP